MAGSSHNNPVPSSTLTAAIVSEPAFTGNGLSPRPLPVRARLCLRLTGASTLRFQTGSRVAHPLHTRARRVPSPLSGLAAGIEAPDLDQDAEEDGLRARRAAGYVNVDGENPVDAASAGVSLPDDA